MIRVEMLPSRRCGAAAARCGCRLWPSLLLAAGALVSTAAAIEVGGRLLGVDYEFKAHAFHRFPIYYQQPTLPEGPFFRRPGPDAWHGKVISAALRLQGIPDADVGDPEVTVTYDRDGFRNPEDLADWEIVVVGDSFTEAGYLPYEDLFTTVLGRLTGRRVKNLGVSYTGTLSHILYLERFGTSPSAAHAVVAFFEANDADDIQRETALRKAPRPPVPPAAPVPVIDALPRQSSFLLAVYRWSAMAWRDSNAPRPPPKASVSDWVNAEFTGGPVPVPLTLAYTPPGPAEMSPKLRDLVDGAIGEWAETARRSGLTPWLLYLPCKRRALDGLLRFSPRAEPRFAAWKPNDLPRWVAERCAAHAVRFVDATPALAADARAGILDFNGIYDSHLNRAGHRTVARVLAEAMAPALAEGGGRAAP
jgi:hypothetical protein